jgi:ABC-type transport system involved in multi-copper enzyme maturation permease subunit
MRSAPSFVDTILAVAKGYLPKAFQARGWVLAGLIALPCAILLLVQALEGSYDPKNALEVYHYAYGQIVLPILALLAAPACISEDMEQRTLPLMLVRPAPSWALPLGKGLLWFAWCAIWLVAIVALMSLAGLSAIPQKMLALALMFWAQLGLVSLMLLVFKRGTLWAALVFFVWDPMVTVLPPALQRITFMHYLSSLSASSYSKGNTLHILSQTQITSPVWLAVTVLVAFGLAAWLVCGLRLMRSPIGLAGREAEG